MSRKGKSYFIESSGPNDAAVVQGFQWLLAEAREAGNVGIVAVSGKGNLDNIANWSQLAAVLHALQKHGVTKIGDVSLQLLTLRTRNVYSWNGPVLVIYGGQELLDVVDGIEGTASVLYVPWEGSEHQNWAATWGASQLGGPAAQPEQAPAVAEIALRSLTQSVNLNTGIAHPSDHERAVHTLETLFHRGVAITPEAIRQHLIRLGWDPKDAAKVKELAEKIWDGRQPKNSTGRADERLWAYWNSKVD